MFCALIICIHVSSVLLSKSRCWLILKINPGTFNRLHVCSLLFSLSFSLFPVCALFYLILLSFSINLLVFSLISLLFRSLIPVVLQWSLSESSVGVMNVQMKISCAVAPIQTLSQHTFLFCFMEYFFSCFF